MKDNMFVMTKDHPDPDPGNLVIGCLMTLTVAALFVGGYVSLGADGLQRGCGFRLLWGRYMIAL